MRHPRHISNPAVRRGGFTLVEMLVSVALVLLIMTLFAQAFGIAAGSIRTQRGVAENDQRARSMITSLLGDLRKRTYRQREDAVTQTVVRPADVAPFSVEDQLIQLQNRANRLSLGIVPLHPDYYNGGSNGAEGTGTSNSTSGGVTPGVSQRFVDINRERGYFYYSEGDPTDDSDDVLQFTIDMSQLDLGNSDVTPLIGRARRINTPDPGSGSAATWFPAANGSPQNVDQPIWDDGKGYQLNAAGFPVTYQAGDTGASESRFAEISYFLRGGKLYHRVLLIRDPLSHMAGAATGLGQPHLGATGAGANMIEGPYDTGGGTPEDGSPSTNGLSDFWNDFDFSAQFYEPGAPGGTNLQVFFAEVASLDNTTGGVKDTSITPERFFALGNPQNRFGHDCLPRTNFLQGQPKEYYDPANGSTHFGRYTHEETSHPEFVYPGQGSYAPGGTFAGASPFQPSTLAGILDGNSDGVTDQFAGGPRRGEDILLSNCHGFDVKIWDDELGAFVDIGHTNATPGGSPGDYHIRQTTNTSEPWDPTPGTDNPGRFQAAHQSMDLYGGRTGAGNNRIFDTWHPAYDFSTNRGNSAGDTTAADDPPPFRPLWSERNSFTAAFAVGGSAGAAPYLTGARPAFYDPDHSPGGTDGYDRGDRVFPRPDPDEPFRCHQSYFYVAERATINSLGTTGLLTGVQDGSRPTPGSDPQWPEAPGATVQDGQIIWKCIPNTIGLKAIQITVRFYDPTSGQIRQLTLTHSFVEL